MTRDHGGGIDAAAARWGGARADWLDLSTGINPVAYPLPPIGPEAWTALPDRGAEEALLAAARRFWRVPGAAAMLAAPGASALIAALPGCLPGRTAAIPGPTYNEHEAAFAGAGWEVVAAPAGADVLVAVHPNNPDGRLWPAETLRAAPIRIIDESFCDVMPESSHIALADLPGTVILKSFGKFWGLAGLRLGFAIGDRAILEALGRRLGPWAVSGPALAAGTAALADPAWAAATRARLARDSARLDALVTARGARAVGGTDLFRLYEVEDAARWQDRLGRARILARVFPHAPRWLRLGMPGPADWTRLEAAL
jgi:cobalamin biosynthetic protein CobC